MQTVGPGAQAPSSTGTPVPVYVDPSPSLTSSRFRTPRRSASSLALAPSVAPLPPRIDRQRAFNVWQLTVEGENLARAVWHQTPPAEHTVHTLRLLRNRGGHLGHRVALAPRVIGAEPELSNNETALRVGIESEEHASTLVGRLARFGLVENWVANPLPLEANARQLTTTTGRELARAIRRHGDPSETGSRGKLRARVTRTART